MSNLYTHYPKYYADEQDFVWCVHELLTSQDICEFFFEDDAKEYVDFLEKGGAFNGFTPSFVLKKTQLTNIDDAFTAEFSE